MLYKYLYNASRDRVSMKRTERSIASDFGQYSIRAHLGEIFLFEDRNDFKRLKSTTI